MSLQEEELVSSHAGQPEQASSLLDQIMAQTCIQPGSKVMTLFGFAVSIQLLQSATGRNWPWTA